MNLIKREPALPVLLATAAVVAGVALLAGGDAVAAAGGVLLALAMWALERLTLRLGERGSFGHGLAVGLLGMMLRVALALGVLVAVGVLADRSTFTAFVLGFVTGYTVYLFVRLWRHPAVSPSH